MSNMVSPANGSNWMCKNIIILLLLNTSITSRWMLAYYRLVDHLERMKITYYPTHMRMGAWIVGILSAYLMHRVRDRRIVLSKVSGA